ncbi:toll/interleukin-1 receptor domain-containing protein [Thauera sinica]|uniref:Toll/interleukin-1 receptor domain-containing protein n=1 Tax=Thauera sinica TaxID=2665146 RepID=A0ABW1APD5_9RHOO|nr:toll/interleukin-1 receptor domain-containing protein [Thauera sp. K11]ATE62487.1 hypothetical protein CCZ27_05250 [Thauera sp. K11]
MDGVFISYRRDDSAGYAGRLYDRLAGYFGSARIFMDVEGIEPGTDFVAAIEDAVGSCRVLIVIIGDEWTNATDAAGRRRLDDPADFIRIETATALRRDIRVVPVLVGGAVMPQADELPPELKPLTRRQAIEINHKQWEASSGELIRTLERILGSGAAPASALSAAAAEPASSPPAGGNGAAGKGAMRWIALSGVAAIVAGSAVWFGVARHAVMEQPVSRTEGEGAGQAAAPSPSAAPAARAAPDVAAATVREPQAVPSAPASVPSATAPAATPVADAPAAAPPAVKAPQADRRVASPVVTVAPRPANPSKPTFSPSLAPGTVREPVSIARTAPAPSALPPVARPEASAAALLAAVPAVEVPRAADAGRPLGGERWTYESRGKWPTSPKRRFEVAVQSVAGEVVTDALKIVEPDTAAGGEVRRWAGGKPGFIEWNGIGTEFSPYWGAFVELSRGEGARGFATPEVGGYWTNWHSVAKVLGEESVRVPAGTFDAYKVEVWSSRNATGGPAQAQLEPVGIHYLVWYAPAAKRYVKMQRRVISASSSESERDVFELVAHRLP